MSLVERLGYKTLDALYEEYDNNMIMEWLAYDLTQNSEWREKTNQQMALESQRNNTPEQEAQLIRNLFANLR